VAYIKALQLSQDATLADVPAGQAVPSGALRFELPGSGATLPVPVPVPESASPAAGESK
jgi:hypothetical protein